MKPPSTELFFYLLEIIPLKTNFKRGGRKFTEFACWFCHVEAHVYFDRKKKILKIDLSLSSLGNFKAVINMLKVWVLF